MRSENNPKQCETLFYYFCIKVLYIAQKKIFRELNRYADRECSLTDLPEYLFKDNKISSIADSEQFQVQGTAITISNESLAEALKKLTEFRRTIVFLYYFQGYRDWEIADLLQINRRTIQYNRSQAINQLRQQMEKNENSCH